MSALDALLHVLNFVLTPVLFGGVVSGFAKLAWRERLHARPWVHLAPRAAALSLLGQLAGVAATGRDGTMTGYGLMLASGSAGLLWAGRAGLLMRP